jgi:hypothetical protein
MFLPVTKRQGSKRPLPPSFAAVSYLEPFSERGGEDADAEAERELASCG